MNQASYRHTQVGWVILVSLGATVVALVVAGGLAGLGLLLAIPVGVLGLVGLLFATLTVEVDDTALSFRFGPGLIGKRFPLDQLRAWAPVTSPWYYGWGIHVFPGGVIYNVSGRHAVELVLRDGRRLRVGTDEPAALCAALTERLGSPSPLAPEEIARVQQRSRRALWIAVALVVAVGAGIGGLFYFQARPTGLVVTKDALTIDTPFYGDVLPLRDITAVSLESSLPPIRLRTNGFALGNTLRGHFRLDVLGDGRLFIEAAVPPFILVRLADAYVVVNTPEPEQTRRLYEALEQAWRAAGPTAR